ncbi:spore coat associated protein CotJA [Paenibacillus sp. NEAU-GSW1]|uniref:spore coat associated protein CotJA n=1 Tax=Paenibacillus sp. NEAU-GSW1 TaxID=2682486 RepID=UPI0012E1D2FC|nr:spore coat associated protein CotJA [Paenibacillus sp. NEAU-GSW1]MUT66960.1 spore coat associated protein CotJA [Paenibacillus sp. NEAU-GSW1]
MSANDGIRYYKPYVGPFDPCPPIRVKSYSTPPQLFIPFQPPNWPQFSPHDALKYGTLWPALYSSYESKCMRKEESEEEAGD